LKVVGGRIKQIGVAEEGILLKKEGKKKTSEGRGNDPELCMARKGLSKSLSKSLQIGKKGSEGKALKKNPNWGGEKGHAARRMAKGKTFQIKRIRLSERKKKKESGNSQRKRE